MDPRTPSADQLAGLKTRLAALARARGFDALGVSGVELGADSA
jgi:hypothetical protein